MKPFENSEVPAITPGDLMQSYSDGYSTLFKNWSAWLHPLIRRGGSTTKIILAESALGFSLGSLW